LEVFEIIAFPFGFTRHFTRGQHTVMDTGCTLQFFLCNHGPELICQDAGTRRLSTFIVTDSCRLARWCAERKLSNTLATGTFLLSNGSNGRITNTTVCSKCSTRMNSDVD
jgi:hypothetical protein